jgi:FkbM family methyltransferase
MKRSREPSLVATAAEDMNARRPARLRDMMCGSSRARYLAWRAVKRGSITVTMLTGERLVMRSAPSTDLSVAYEIFVNEIYRPHYLLDSARVHRIVDVGANVGYSLVYFARLFPNATLEAFEPHPEHIAMIARNLAENDLKSRTIVHPMAAGIAEGLSWLSDAGASSALGNQRIAGRIPVSVADFFKVVGDRPLDLLKIDCEGGEYELLMDPRFEHLPVKTIVLEWHATPEHPRADDDIRQKLRSLGWSLAEREEYCLDFRFGVLWGYRKN